MRALNIFISNCLSFDNMRRSGFSRAANRAPLVMADFSLTMSVRIDEAGPVFYLTPPRRRSTSCEAGYMKYNRYGKTRVWTLLQGQCHRTMSTAVLVGAILTASPALADTQGWAGLFISGPVKGDVGVWVESQVRVTDDISRVGQSNLRIGAGWEPSRDFSLYGGYAIVRNTPAKGAASTEHRIWQQAIFAIIDRPAFRVISRTRLEQRWREGQVGTSLRTRQMIRATIPLGKRTAPSLVGSTEMFGELQSTGWGVRSGLDQLRTFGGISVPVRPKTAIEFGYLNQAPLATNRVGPNHIIQATLVARF